MLQAIRVSPKLDTEITTLDQSGPKTDSRYLHDAVQKSRGNEETLFLKRLSRRRELTMILVSQVQLRDITKKSVSKLLSGTIRDRVNLLSAAELLLHLSAQFATLLRNTRVD